jgi:uncharacterized membrane protein
MPVRHGGIVSAPLLILTGIAPWLITRVTMGAGSPPLTFIVIAAQVTMVVWLLGGKLAVRYRTGLAVTALAAFTIAMLRLGLPARAVGLAVGGVCHAAAYTVLLSWFVLSLRPPTSGRPHREPVVTVLARRMRRTMPDPVVRYTRRVTVAWCVFFAAQLAMSAGLVVAAPLSVWASFISVWNVPLIAAMVLVEFACRSILMRREQRTGLVATLAGMRQISSAP